MTFSRANRARADALCTLLRLMQVMPEEGEKLPSAKFLNDELECFYRVQRRKPTMTLRRNEGRLPRLRVSNVWEW